MKIAAVQMDVKLGDVEGNLARILEKFAKTREEGAQLAVFPECVVTGYCFESLDEAQRYAQPISGPTTQHVAAACARLGGFVVFGMLERDGDDVFNAAVLVGADGVIGSYRKVHLPYLGVDMFTAYGDRPFAVHDAGGLKVGLNICYDAAFPEAARTLSILSADLIALPTNWPPGAECVAQHCINARAMENGVYYVAANRIGTERGFEFIGGSSICDPSGHTLARSGPVGEEILYAEIDPQRSRQKHVVRVPGKHEIHRMADRRPEMYGPLVEPHSWKSPGRE